MSVIRKYCCIHAGKCFLDGALLFQSEQETAKEFLAELYREIKPEYPKFFKMDVLAKARLPGCRIVDERDRTRGRPENRSVFCHACSCLDTDRHYQDTIGEAYFPSPSVFVYTLPNIVLGEICIRHRIFGENTFFVAPEFPVSQLRRYTEQVFADSGLERALVGWLECEGNTCEVMALLVEKQGEGIEFTDENINRLKR